MEKDTRDYSVPREVQALLSEERLILRETKRAITPFGGVAVFVAYLHKVGFGEKLTGEHFNTRSLREIHRLFFPIRELPIELIIRNGKERLSTPIRQIRENLHRFSAQMH